MAHEAISPFNMQKHNGVKMKRKQFCYTDPFGPFIQISNCNLEFRSKQTSANEKMRFSFVCSFVNKRQTNANEKTKKTKYTNDKQTKKTLFSVCLNFLKLIFLKKILCN